MQIGKQSSTIVKENLSQDDLAEIIFVSRQSISNWEWRPTLIFKTYSAEQGLKCH